MHVIEAEPLSRETFSEFGEYYDCIKTSGYALCGELHRFFPDRITGWADTRVGFSPIHVKKPKKMQITQVEYHVSTWEIILPLNDDMIIHVSPVSGETPHTELTKAFLVPKHTLVKINTGVWHLAPLPQNEQELCALIVLPESTYARDCTVVQLGEKEQFEIIR